VSGNFTPFDKNGPYIKEGNVQGLYHLVLGQGQNAFVGHGEYTYLHVRVRQVLTRMRIGLGGTSLLNANVFLEADSKTLAMCAWPEALRKPGALDKCMFVTPKFCTAIALTAMGWRLQPGTRCSATRAVS